MRWFLVIFFVFCISLISVYSIDYNSLSNVSYNNLPEYRIKVDFNLFKEYISSNVENYNNCINSNCVSEYNTLSKSNLNSYSKNNSSLGISNFQRLNNTLNLENNNLNNNYPSFDLNFNNEGVSASQTDYFDKPTGATTRHYIYDFVEINENIEEKYYFKNLGEISNLRKVEVNEDINLNKNNTLIFYGNFNKKDYLILPTTSADDYVKKFYLKDEAIFYWNKNNQLLAFKKNDSNLEFKADITSYDYYDEKYDDGDISLLNNYNINLNKNIKDKAFEFLNKENKYNLKEIIDSKSIKFKLDKLLNYYKTFEEKPVYLEYFNDSSLDVYQQISLGRGGACRHRAMSFFITANSVGLPTRIVYNDIHEFVEVLVPVNNKLVWKAFNLGGAKINVSYEKSKPNKNNLNNQNSNTNETTNNNTTTNNQSKTENNKSNNTNETTNNNQSSKNETSLLNLSNSIIPPIINLTNTTKNDSKISEIKKVSKINYWIVSIIIILVIIIILSVIFYMIKKRKKYEEKDIFGKEKINLKNVKKDEIDLIIESFIKEYKTNPWGVVVQTYVYIQEMISLKMNITIEKDMTPREFLKKIPKEYNLSNLYELVELYEKAYFGKKATPFDAYEAIKLFCIIIGRRIK